VHRQLHRSQIVGCYLFLLAREERQAGMDGEIVVRISTKMYRQQMILMGCQLPAGDVRILGLQVLSEQMH